MILGLRLRLALAMQTRAICVSVATRLARNEYALECQHAGCVQLSISPTMCAVAQQICEFWVILMCILGAELHRAVAAAAATPSTCISII